MDYEYCENCDRNNVVRCYCYFSRRPIYFYLVTGKIFTVPAFAVFAVEMELAWSIPRCKLVPRSEHVFYWKMMYPYLVVTLQRHNAGESFQDMSNFDVD